VSLDIEKKRKEGYTALLELLTNKNEAAS